MIIPYEVKEDFIEGQYIFAFSSIHCEYYVYFEPLKTLLEDGVSVLYYLEQNGYFFGFASYDEEEYVLKKKERPFEIDKRIATTICNIIRTFFKRFSTVVLIYYCDPIDNKQASRHRLFKKWDEIYCSDLIAYRIDTMLRVEDDMHFLGCFAFCSEGETDIVKEQFFKFAELKVPEDKRSQKV
ncbi:hypothetical protein DVR12_21985 [Chitinophaga silvatica]|uniref:Uncharacterized protein n=1 Tax=Chitinophaga silvatica TaxID=2282649 RepID=A0A3E1Y507_9BACT|nr:DUF6169 family protein [Chitinophaga silvatica]RFS19769.1 hypothetical protein DVR12_21985 [Chitinophaga silvatica]